jgi:hypothetical protein
MRLRTLLECGAAVGLAAWLASTAAAQFRPVAPITPMPVTPVPIAPMPIAPMPITPLPLRPALPSPLTPVITMPAPAPSPFVPTRPEPPVVRENPPVLPTRHDDSPKTDDPFWMSKELDKLNKERKEWKVTYDVSQAPPPPPPPLDIPRIPIVPTSKESSDDKQWTNWLVLAAMLVGSGAFALGRVTRRR